MRRILVTGGTGFIGRHAVSSLLRRGAEVTILTRGTWQTGLGAPVRPINVDLLNAGDLSPALGPLAADTLIHLAWETRHGYFWQAQENLDWVGASLRLTKAFAAAGGRRIVCAGTCAEYVAPPVGPCIAGVTPIAPKHLYAVAKDAFHRILTAYSAQAGLSYAWGRVFFLTGPDEASTRLVPSAIRALAAGEAFCSGSGERVRDFMDPRDCGAAFAELALSELQGGFNVASGRPTTIAGLLDTLADLMGRRDLLRIGALPDRPDEPANLWGDAAWLGEIGFASSFTLRESLASSVSSYSRREQRIAE